METLKALYASIGLKFIELEKDSKEPIAGKSWKKNYFTGNSVEKLLNSNKNIGLILDERLICIDIDSIDALLELNAINGEDWIGLDGAPLQKTPHGWHVVYRVPETHKEHIGNNEGTLPQGVNVRSQNAGYIVVEPSIVENNEYYWEEPLKEVDQIPYLPEWILELIKTPKPKSFDTFNRTEDKFSQAVDRAVRNLAISPKGTRNNALSEGVYTLAGIAAFFDISKDELNNAIKELETISINLGLTVKEVKATIKSGLKAGLQKPYCPEKFDGRYMILKYDFLESSSWMSISNDAKVLYLTLRKFYNGSNNGKIHLSISRACELLSLSNKSIIKCFNELIDNEIIEKTSLGNNLTNKSNTYKLNVL